MTFTVKITGDGNLSDIALDLRNLANSLDKGAASIEEDARQGKKLEIETNTLMLVLNEEEEEEYVQGFSKEDILNKAADAGYPMTDDQYPGLRDYIQHKWDCGISMSQWEQLEALIRQYAQDNGMTYREIYLTNDELPGTTGIYNTDQGEAHFDTIMWEWTINGENVDVLWWEMPEGKELEDDLP